MSVQIKQFSVPVTLQNLPPAESLNQLIDNLNFLCNVMDEAFDNLQSQVSSHRTHIHSISKRVADAQVKTDLIAKYPNKATTVYSFSEFPKEEGSCDQPLVNMTAGHQAPIRPKYKLSNDQRHERPQITDTLTLFHSLTEKTAEVKLTQPVGLGALPEWTQSVSDCLLFNTDENPYRKYDAYDALEGEEGKDKEIKEKKMAAQPHSMLKNTLMDSDAYDITYRPELGDVPRFSVSKTLSGLGGIAMDLSWQGGGQATQRIAPAAVAFDALPNLGVLPDIDDFAFGDDVAPPGLDDIAPPPPPDAPDAPSPSDPTGSGAPPAPDTSDATSPAQDSSESTSHAAAPVVKKKAGASGGGTGRNALLDAIKLGAKSGLKKSSRKLKNKPLPKPAKLGLMDHLKLKLKARNQLMRGVTDKSGNKGDDMLAPPNLDDDDGTGAKGPLSPSIKRKKSQEDKTGLGLSNVPKHMSSAMLFAEESSEHLSTDNDWHSDDE